MATTMCLLMAMCRRLREAVGTMNKGEFEELERRLGWNWDPGLPARLQKLNPHHDGDVRLDALHVREWHV